MRNQQPLCENYYKRFANTHERLLQTSAQKVLQDVKEQGQQVVRLLQKVRTLIEVIAREIARPVSDD
ncbi:MAG: hypothetical protein ABJB66_10555 [Gemmatimonadaceae bacterium]